MKTLWRRARAYPGGVREEQAAKRHGGAGLAARLYMYMTARPPEEGGQQQNVSSSTKRAASLCLPSGLRWAGRTGNCWRRTRCRLNSAGIPGGLGEEGYLTRRR